MFRVTGKSTLYFDSTGLAAARIEVRAFRVVMIPAFAIETVCCSWSSRQWKSPGSDARTDHNFMKDTTRRIRHFIKFVNAADTPVTQNESATEYVISHEERMHRSELAFLEPVVSNLDLE